ncbi:hypothetical protein B4U79_05683 [Dinothrombium tinctorium]|nr:hypothetical protein B4U79_05683 [Dinothrombium tinctorium]
MHMLIR